jgi:ABC-2 type transport system ATP-binding protein
MLNALQKIAIDIPMDIDIQGLTKSFGRVQALTGVTLRIPTGMYALLGPNGAGKTTLMRILAGIYQPSKGQVRVGPYQLATNQGRQAIKQVLGYLPQELGLYPDLSAAEFLDYIGILKGLAHPAQRHERVAQLLETVNLANVASRKLKGFSGGMKRRLGIAQALLNNPLLLIVDEPTAGLDPEERIRFRNLLIGLAGDRTVLLSTHIVEDVAQTTSRLAVMAAGAVIFQGRTAELVEIARGWVWTLDTTSPIATEGLTVVSALPQDTGMRYRVVSATPPTPAAQTTEPTLEDGYVALMQQQRVRMAKT